MKNFLLLFVLFLSLASGVFAQNATPGSLPTIEKKGRKYYTGSEQIKSGTQFKNVIDQAGDAETSKQFRSASGLTLAGTAFSAAGGFASLLSSLSSAKGIEPGETSGSSGKLMAVGLGSCVSGLVMVLVGNGQRKKAIRRYNDIAQGRTKANPSHSFQVTPAPQGMGLGLTYSFGR